MSDQCSIPAPETIVSLLEISRRERALLRKLYPLCVEAKTIRIRQDLLEDAEQRGLHLTTGNKIPSAGRGQR